MSRTVAMVVALLAGVLLAACTTSDVLEPSSLTGTQQPPASTTPSPAISAPDATAATSSTTASGQTAPGQVAAINSSTKIQFAPIVGSTVEAVTPLTERIALKARERGIGLARSDDPTATHVLKGYLSAISEGNGTTVIYVWDVLDASGNRLHRIQGQQKATGKGEGWVAVSGETMQSIADVTVNQLATWLAGRSG
ncbi:hypothetical protein [Mesorhizobium sp. 1B3]|uniref:hypothetical protein n=1 Tax=Mesorhizobium sp. 1B3 TaxID=3243599 RepID=UPI003D962764